MMNSTTTTGLALALTALLFVSPAAATPAAHLEPRQMTMPSSPSTAQTLSQDEVRTAITDWLTDVKTVNEFLNSPPRFPAALRQKAAQIKVVAAREPNDLMTLSKMQGMSAKYNAATAQLGQVFGPGVLDNLQKIVDSDGRPMAAVNAIQRTRCCQVLPDVEILLPEAASMMGLTGQVETAVPRPNACGTTINLATC